MADDAGALEGRWDMVRAELAGVAAPELAVANIQVEISAGNYAVKFGNHVADRGSYALDPHPTHAAMTFRGVEGPNAGKSIPCIYQLVGDRLRVCYGLDGARPSAFATTPAAQHYLATYKRASDQR